jgi:hypothetical protein
MPSHPNVSATRPDDADPGIDSVFRFLTYSLSLPERAVRGTTAIVSGLVGESAQLLIPGAFQDSRTYKTFVSQMLDFLAKDVGGVRKPSPGADNPAEPSGENVQVENFVARKTVANFIDLAGLATIHVSPLMILAIVSDVAYGSKAYLQELAGELRKQGVIDERSTINGVQDLLDSIGHATGTTAQSMDLAPLTVEEVRKSLAQTAEAVRQIDVRKALPQAEVRRLWDDMKSVSEQQQVTLFQIGSAMAMYSLNQAANLGKGAVASVQVAGQLFDRRILEHYRTGLSEINNKGIYGLLAESSQPYFDAVWNNFSTRRPTLTEGLLHGKLTARLWSGVKGLFGKPPGEPPVSSDPNPPA